MDLPSDTRSPGNFVLLQHSDLYRDSRGCRESLPRWPSAQRHTRRSRARLDQPARNAGRHHVVSLHPPPQCPRRSSTSWGWAARWAFWSLSPAATPSPPTALTPSCAHRRACYEDSKATSHQGSYCRHLMCVSTAGTLILGLCRSRSTQGRIRHSPRVGFTGAPVLLPFCSGSQRA